MGLSSFKFVQWASEDASMLQQNVGDLRWSRHRQSVVASCP